MLLLGVSGHEEFLCEFKTCLAPSAFSFEHRLLSHYSEVMQQTTALRFCCVVFVA
ncbi:hypothetical protein KPSA1_01713 [Pseudomonas syringae pv. actinidiae]|uniref:Uncharacterized protein n=1 Tax=Pseudomonas syringae pv. actinidiae TaxID=103796 RepID=A0A2V0QGK2_PSESF|nr:hypothetical protein KPSA1_01713 [Pseudomonas syringae pv. actinidiae]